MSLAKNIKSITSIGPRAIVTWDKAERIRRNEEIWSDRNSIVHRLPEHYKRRYWENLLRDATPVHYRPPLSRYVWDPMRRIEIEAENYPITGFRPPESDEGLWGGESVVKGWIESKPYTKKKVLPRFWVPRLFFPYLKKTILYSEILDKYMEIVVTERALRLIDSHYGLDMYILETPDIDLASKLAFRLKREMLLSLANENYHTEDEERHDYVKRKYSRFVISAEESDWIGLDLNEAARKQQQLEESVRPEPLKYSLEMELVEKLKLGEDVRSNEEQYVPQTQESQFGDKLLGKYLNPIGKKLRK